MGSTRRRFTEEYKQHGVRASGKWVKARDDGEECGDITYIKTWTGWAYLATVIGLHSRTVVGWAIDDHMLRRAAIGPSLNGRTARDRLSPTPRVSQVAGGNYANWR